jgi:hypothetical protein
MPSYQDYWQLPEPPASKCSDYHCQLPKCSITRAIVLL